jgi:hypothetical protein
MKKIFFLLVLVFFNLCVFSQNIVVDRFVSKPWDIDFKGRVKKITLKNFKFELKKETTDTVLSLSEFYFSKKRKLVQVKDYNKSLNNLSQVVDYDGINRVFAISRKKDEVMSVVLKQYFGHRSMYPDSIHIFRPEYSQIEKYVNNFNKTLLVKQEHYINNKLQDYRVYKYDSSSRLIEDLYINPENESGESLKTSEASGTYKMTFYPQRQTLFEYKRIKDTLISVKVRPGKTSFKEVKKEIKDDKFSLEIIEEYEGDYHKMSRFIYKSKDSISNISYYYKNKKEVVRFYKTLTTPERIVSVIKSDFYTNGDERISITEIKTDFDVQKNWIRKTYSEDKKILKIITREIDYY